MVIHYVHNMDHAKAFYVSVFDGKPTLESPRWTLIDFGAIEVALDILNPNSAELRRPEGGVPVRESSGTILAQHSS